MVIKVPVLGKMGIAQPAKWLGFSRILLYGIMYNMYYACKFWKFSNHNGVFR